MMPAVHLKTGTIMEESPIGLDKWLTAMWQIVNCKNGISPMKLLAQLVSRRNPLGSWITASDSL